MTLSRRTLIASGASCLAALASPGSPARAASGKHRRPIRRGRAPRIPWLRGGLPNVQSRGALVVDLASGDELFARHSDDPHAIASVSKLAAALVVLDLGLKLDDLTRISRADVEVARGGARSRLAEDTTLSNRDLLHAAMLGSDNRAVSALGRAVGLSARQLTAAMNRKAAALRLSATRFRDPVGLSPENVSTPRETIALLHAAMAHPALAPVLRRAEYDVHPLGQPSIKYFNTYRPAIRPNTEVLAGKTGFNFVARYCLVLAARVAGKDYGMSFLGAEGELTRFGDVARVVDWIVAYKPKGKPPAPSAARAT